MLLVTARFQIAERALPSWLKKHEETGSVAPKPHGGGNRSPIDPVRLDAVFVQKRLRPFEQERSDIQVKRASFIRRMKRSDGPAG